MYNRQLFKAKAAYQHYDVMVVAKRTCALHHFKKSLHACLHSTPPPTLQLQTA